MMATGDDALVIIRSRIAQPLNIQTGDTIEAVLNQTGDTIQLPKVTVRDTIASDILIHDFFSLGLIGGMKRDQNGEFVHLVASDRDLCIRNQYLWAGLRIVPTHAVPLGYYSMVHREIILEDRPVVGFVSNEMIATANIRYLSKAGVISV